MPEKPITPDELPGIIRDLDMLISTLKTHLAGLSALSFDELVTRHGTWIDLHQVGGKISYLAQKLDSTYQAQFGTLDDNPDFHYLLTDPPATGAEGADVGGLHGEE
jgi:hypothetical protein